jgi:hypothetical protein
VSWRPGAASNRRPAGFDSWAGRCHCYFGRATSEKTNAGLPQAPSIRQLDRCAIPRSVKRSRVREALADGGFAVRHSRPR